MGYTHYWNINPKTNEAKYKKALKDCVKIVEHGTKKGILAGWDGTGKPEIKGGIRFNGKAPEDYETFKLPNKPMDVLEGDFVQKDKDGYVFDFCKTGHRPYDIYVTACLATMRSHLGKNFKISSDGGEEAFKEGQEFADQILGKNVLSMKKNESKEVVLYEWSIDNFQGHDIIHLKTKKFDDVLQYSAHIDILSNGFEASVSNPNDVIVSKNFKNLESAVNFCEKELFKAFNEDPENRNYGILISRNMREK